MSFLWHLTKKLVTNVAGMLLGLLLIPLLPLLFLAQWLIEEHDKWERRK